MNRWVMLWVGIIVSGSLALATEGGLYRGIDDERVLELIRLVPGKPSRWNVPPEDGRFLYDLVAAKGYRRGLEIGTSNGYSALWLGLAFRANGGKLVTLEVDQERGMEARQNFRKAGLENVVELRINDAFQEIPKLVGDFDFVFIDAWKRDYKKFLDLVLPRVSKGGAITAHNVISLGGDMKDFLEAIESDPRLETKIHQTSSEGISVSFIRR
ncbi:MAG: O-methyltransferase [Acidobacteriota bacterium]